MMKKILFALLLFPSIAFCDTKLSALPSTTTLNSGDIIPVVTNPITSPGNFTITKANLISTLGISASSISAANQYSPAYYTNSGTTTTIGGLAPGTSGYVLTSAGSGAAPFYAAIPVVASSAIFNQSTLQAGAIFNVSSGSVNGQFTANSIKATTLTVASTSTLSFSIATNSSFAPGGEVAAVAGLMTNVPSASSIDSVDGILGVATQTGNGSGTSDDTRGVIGIGKYTGKTTAQSVEGGSFQAQNLSTGTIVSQSGVYSTSFAQFGSKTTNNYGFITHRYSLGGSTITNNYGFYSIAASSAIAMSSGTITNNYSMYLEPETAGINNFGIVEAGAAPNTLGGTLTASKGINTSTLTITSLTSQACLGTDGSGNVQAGTCAGSGGGASTLGVNNFGVSVTSPTSQINFIGPIVVTASGSTATVTLSQISLSTGVMGSLPASQIAAGSLGSSVIASSLAATSGNITAGTNVTVSGTWPFQTVNASGSGSSPASPLNSVQFNNAGSFGGSSLFKFFGSSLSLNNTGIVALDNNGNTLYGQNIGDSSVISGSNNACIGDNTCRNLSTGTLNVGIGYLALERIQGGQNNVAIGGGAGDDIITGFANTCVGGGNNANQPCQSITFGSSNTMVGAGTGSTGMDPNSSLNTYIGLNAGPGTGAGGLLNNSICIGANCIVSSSNTARIGGVGANNVVVFMDTVTVSSMTLTNVKSGTQCLHADAGGHISGAGADCSTPITTNIPIITTSQQFDIPYYSLVSSNTLAGTSGEFQILPTTGISVGDSGPGAITVRGTGGVTANTFTAGSNVQSQGYFYGSTSGKVDYVMNASGASLGVIENTGGQQWDLGYGNSLTTPGSNTKVLKWDTSPAVTVYSSMSILGSNGLNTSFGASLGSVTLRNVASGTQCLQADSSGNVTGTGSSCGGSGGSGGYALEPATVTIQANQGITVLNSTITLNRNNIGSSIVDGFVIQNTTAATNGNQQYSPSLRLTGQGWKTASTASSKQADWTLYAVPVQGTFNPTELLYIIPQIDQGGYATNQGLVLNSNGSTTVPQIGLNGTGATGTGIGSSATNTFNFIIGSNDTIGFAANKETMVSSGLYGWSSGAPGNSATQDTAFSRVSAGVVALGNGNAGNITATLNVSSISVSNIVSTVAVAGTATFQKGISASTLTISGIASGTQCLHADSSGNVTGTGSDCGSGGSSGLVSLSTGVVGILPAANMVSTVAYTSVANTFTSSQTINANTSITGQLFQTLHNLTGGTGIGMSALVDTTAFPNSTNIALSGQATSSSNLSQTLEGVEGFAFGSIQSTGTAYGVYGHSTATGGKSIGLYGNASGGSQNYGLLIDTGQVQINSSMTVTQTALFSKGASVSTFTITGLTSQSCIGTDGSGNVQAGTCSGGGSSLTYSSFTATAPITYNGSGVYGLSNTIGQSETITGSSFTVNGINGLLVTGATSGPLVIISTAPGGVQAVSVSSTLASAPSDGVVTVSSQTGTITFQAQYDGHLVSSGTTPSVGTCGTSPSVVGTDTTGHINVGGGVVTSCTLNFANQFINNAPDCIASTNSTAAFADVTTVSTTSVTFGLSATLGSGVIWYHCFGEKG